MSTKSITLVDRIVELAFRLRPIDTERYELGVFLDELSGSFESCWQILSGDIGQDVDGFAHEAASLVALAVDSQMREWVGLQVSSKEGRLAEQLRSCYELPFQPKEFLWELATYGPTLHVVRVFRMVAAELCKTNA